MAVAVDKDGITVLTAAPGNQTPVGANRARRGDVVRITGSGFSTFDNTVKFDTVAAVLNAQSATVIDAVIPIGTDINFQAIVEVTNNEDETSDVRHLMILKDPDLFISDFVDDQQPSPFEDVDAEDEQRAESKDWERLGGLIDTWTQVLLPRAGNETAPNVSAGAVRIGTNKDTFSNLTTSPPTLDQVQDILESMDAQFGTLNVTGKVVDFQFSLSSAAASTTATIPLDATPPQNTEGGAFTDFDTTITPKAAGNRLLILGCFHVATTANNAKTVALFRDAIVDAIAAVESAATAADVVEQMPLIHVETAGSTAATTFRIRMGGSTAGTTQLHRGGRFGAAIKSALVVIEVAP